MTIRLHIERLDWDEWNRTHIAKHGVIPDEASEAVWSDPLTEESYKGRYRLIGETLSGQALCVIVGETPRERGLFYVFSARPAHRTERDRLRLFRESGSSR
jgi:uncharacterized DUF497 family protein